MYTESEGAKKLTRAAGDILGPSSQESQDVDILTTVSAGASGGGNIFDDPLATRDAADLIHEFCSELQGTIDSLEHDPLVSPLGAAADMVIRICSDFRRFFDHLDEHPRSRLFYLVSSISGFVIPSHW
jgi:hypothetical protein